MTAVTGGAANSVRVGELRPNQLLHTYGVGSVADLPNLSVVVQGLDAWDLTHASVITEDRLLAVVRSKLGPQVETLRTPPYVPESSDPFAEWTRVGVPVGLFPRWLRCSDTRCNRLAPARSGLFEILTHAFLPDRIRYVHNCRGRGAGRPTAVPARFVLACPAGHLDDFPWLYFVHRGADVPDDGLHTLTLVERGTTGEAANVIVVCACGSRRSMAEAFGTEAERNLPRCRGHHPHLGTFDDCQAQPRTLALGATNSWFAMQVRVFSLPRADEPLEQLVAENWSVLEALAAVPGNAAGALLRGMTCWPALEPHGVDAVLQAIARRAASAEEDADDPMSDPVDLAGPEWAAFTRPDPVELPDFTTRRGRVPAGKGGWLGQVVLVPRLREVAALYGFTRIDAPEWDVVATDERQRVPLREEPPTWVPCAEMRGEGLFLRLTEERVAAWEIRPEVVDRGRLLFAAHAAWREQRRLPPDQWPGIRYVLLHTFAHVLIRQFALECGYNAAGIAERVYARPAADGQAAMAGVLLYTAAPDSEGTLGGLVSLGDRDRLGTLVDQALEAARLCSSDPLCAEHDPRTHGRLSAAACHACLFAAETSCERGNHYLDRALLVDTIDGSGTGFFTA